MSESILTPPSSTSELLIALTATFALGAVIFLASFEQGAATGGTPLLHELFHDARHLLGIPCH